MSKRILAKEWDDESVTNLKKVLPVGLAAATLAAVFPFFAGSALLLLPPFTELVLQAGLIPGAEADTSVQGSTIQA